MKKISVYIHIPFCRSKCYYCDFLSFPGQEERFGAYMDALDAEIEASAPELSGYTVDTILFGGGTPTAIAPDGLIRGLERWRKTCEVSDGAEVTVEANPDTVRLGALRELRAAGFNRLSLGVQSFNDGLLKRIGRAHTAAGARDAYADACEAGFENINVDLMFSIPGQSSGDFAKTLETAIALSPEHISCYGLTVEPSTPIGAEGYEPEEDADRSMYALAREMLTAEGYGHYEISNFALPGHRSRHNLAYWTGLDYRGFGLGAHSLVDGTRFHNDCALDSYISGHGACNRFNVETLRESDRIAEFMFLGLRLLDGINCKDFSRKFDKNIYREYGEQIKELAELGLLLDANGQIRLTPRGIDLSNQVFARFV
jgi:oxygen-independent coproporphyrinogen-3 oxidase